MSPSVCMSLTIHTQFTIDDGQLLANCLPLALVPRHSQFELAPERICAHVEDFVASVFLQTLNLFVVWIDIQYTVFYWTATMASPEDDERQQQQRLERPATGAAVPAKPGSRPVAGRAAGPQHWTPPKLLAVVLAVVAAVLFRNFFFTAVDLSSPSPPSTSLVYETITTTVTNTLPSLPTQDSTQPSTMSSSEQTYVSLLQSIQFCCFRSIGTFIPSWSMRGPRLALWSTWFDMVS